MKSRLQCYGNNSSSPVLRLKLAETMEAQIFISGDSPQNPGRIRNPCSVCDRPVSINHHALCCTRCKKRSHSAPKCGSVFSNDYRVSYKKYLCGGNVLSALQIWKWDALIWITLRGLRVCGLKLTSYNFCC